MTEAEAKTKWCPFARLAETPGTYNRCGPAANLECVGSYCMAWRELHPMVEREDHSGARGFMAEIAVKTGRIVRREGPPGSCGRLIIDAAGFCGLAGKP